MTPMVSSRRTPTPSRRLAAAAAAALSCFALSACAQVDSDAPGEALGLRVVAMYPHDPNAFTQGLAVHDGALYEGTGQYGESTLREVDVTTGAVERLVSLDRRYFGEGVTILGDRAYQLTWRSGIGFVYDVASFELIQTFRYAAEGWGLTHDGEHLIMSDGTATLRYLDPGTYAVTRTLLVREGERPVVLLNELEWVDGEIWSNVWYDDRIARIDPESGRVLGWIDLAALYPRSERASEDVLNGIAYDPDSGRIFVTGKNWPRLFELAVRD